MATAVTACGTLAGLQEGELEVADGQTDLGAAVSRVAVLIDTEDSSELSVSIAETTSLVGVLLALAETVLIGTEDERLVVVAL